MLVFLGLSAEIVYAAAIGVALAIAFSLYEQQRSPPPSSSSAKPIAFAPLPSLAFLNEPGSISLIMGPMFSGKTRELIRRYDVRKIAGVINGHNSILIKWSQDLRYNNDPSVATSHAGIERKDAVPAKSLSDCAHLITKDVKYIFIDEGQFFPDLKVKCVEWARSDRIITISGLNAYATGALWPQIAQLLPCCREVVHLPAVCEECGRQDATLSVERERKATTVSEIRVGGKELYKAVCIRCHHPG